LQEYHYNAAHYHNNSAAYHDEASQLFDSAAEYHNNAVEYHHSEAKYHRVRFLSPLASYFPDSGKMQESVAGSVHGSPDIQGDEARLSTTSTLRPSSMSATDPKHASIPTAGDNAQPATESTNATQATDTGRPIKWIIRAKTPSFSSDSETEVYNGLSVHMNADKGWKPDVKRVKKKKSKSACSHPRSTSSDTSTVKHISAPISGSGLQVPSFDTQDNHSRSSSANSGLKVPTANANGTHSRTSSGISGLSRITTASGVTGDIATTGFLDQDELMTRMLNPQQQVRNAENHVKAMREALAKAYRDREDAEDRAAVAEALLKSSLELRVNDFGDNALMEKFRLTDEKLNVSQALLDKSRERNVEYEDRMIRAERLVQRMADKVKLGVPAILNSANADVAEIQGRLIEAVERAEKAENTLKETIAGLEGDRTQAYREAIKRAEIAEKRAQTAEELQEKDRLWTVDADERAVHAEEHAFELLAQLARANRNLAEHQIPLTRAISRAEKAEQDLKDAESELEAFENHAVEFEKEAYEYKIKFNSLKGYTDKLQEHHNEREKEYMACNEEWKNREDDFVKQTMELKLCGDEGVSKYKGEIKKLDETIQDMHHDKELILSTLTTTINMLNHAGKVMEQEQVDGLVEWAAKSPGSKKGKEVSDSVAVTREKARRTLEGQAFTPSLDSGAFDNAPIVVPKVAALSSSAPPFIAISPTNLQGTDAEDALLAKQLAVLQGEDGVLKLPQMSGLRWYHMNKTPK